MTEAGINGLLRFFNLWGIAGASGNDGRISLVIVEHWCYCYSNILTLGEEHSELFPIYDCYELALVGVWNFD